MLTSVTTLTARALEVSAAIGVLTIAMRVAARVVCHLGKPGLRADVGVVLSRSTTAVDTAASTIRINDQRNATTPLGKQDSIAFETRECIWVVPSASWSIIVGQDPVRIAGEKMRELNDSNAQDAIIVNMVKITETVSDIFH